MQNANIAKCFDSIFGSQTIDMERLNQVYLKTAKKPLQDIPKTDAVGFKMRFRQPHGGLLGSVKFSNWHHLTRSITNNYLNNNYKKMMVGLFKQHNITVFFAVRQDMLRWGLSKYHGSGDGKKGHLQFDLASGKIRTEDIGSVTVDVGKFKKIIEHCHYVHREKKALYDEFRAQNIPCAVLRYENFLDDKTQYFKEFYRQLNIEKTEEQINKSIADGTTLKKVHGNDISSFVINHEEIQEKFGDEFFAW